MGGITSVINTYMESEILDEYEQIHIATAASSNKLKVFLRGLWQYLSYIMKNKVLLSHIHMSENGSCDRAIILVLLSYFFKIPVIIHSHGSEMEKWYLSLKHIHKNIFGFAMKRVEKIIVLTPGWKQFWKNIVDDNKIVVIPNSVVVKQYSNKVYMKENKLNIVFLGYIGERKGTFDLLKAVKILKDNNVDFYLRIGGNGEIDKCIQLIKKLELQEYVKVYGWIGQEEKDNILEISDVLVLPSYYESFGIVILEAMAKRLPVICGDGGYSKEIISEGYDGYVIKSGDIENISQVLISCCDKDLLKKMGNIGYEKVIFYYSEKKIMRKVMNIYKAILYRS